MIISPNPWLLAGANMINPAMEYKMTVAMVTLSPSVNPQEKDATIIGKKKKKKKMLSEPPVNAIRHAKYITSIQCTTRRAASSRKIRMSYTNTTHALYRQ